MKQQSDVVPDGGDIRLSDIDPSDVRIIDSEMHVPLFVGEGPQRAA
jgi:hypothetical protein